MIKYTSASDTLVRLHVKVSRHASHVGEIVASGSKGAMGGGLLRSRAVTEQFILLSGPRGVQASVSERECEKNAGGLLLSVM